MQIRESSLGTWSSSASFVWVATGAVVGMGNLTRLPYLMGQHGGVAFLLVYVAALITLALPLLLMEWQMGRWTRSDAAAAYVRLAADARAHRVWGWGGVVSLVCGLIVLSYFSVIAGWCAGYIFRAASGLFDGASEEKVREVFVSLAQDPERSLAWHTLFLVMACIIVAHGVKQGIERLARVWIPIALVLAIAVCAFALAYGNSTDTLAYVFSPSTSSLGWRGVVEALSQAFFTLGLGMGVMMTFGSYLPSNSPLLRQALMVVVLDTLFSLTAGFAIFTLLFSGGQDPAPVLTLMFQRLPLALPPGFTGTLMAVMLYGMVFIVTLASATALLEPLTRLLMERRRAPRVFAATTAAMLIWFVGLGTLLSFSANNSLTFLGLNFFEWAQWLTYSVLVPLSLLATCIFVSRVVPVDLQRALWGERNPRWFPVWAWLLRYPARIALIVVLVAATGLLDWLVKLWAPA